MTNPFCTRPFPLVPHHLTSATYHLTPWSPASSPQGTQTQAWSSDPEIKAQAGLFPLVPRHIYWVQRGGDSKPNKKGPSDSIFKIKGRETQQEKAWAPDWTTFSSEQKRNKLERNGEAGYK